MNYWLIKSEPKKYPFSQMKADRRTFWDGVRNYQARNNMQAMKKGDYCLFYHSNEGKEIVGLCTVVKEAYQDPTTTDDKWVAVDVAYKSTLKHPVTLEMMKLSTALASMAMIKQSRLSVSPVTTAEFELIMKMGGNK